MLKGNTQQQRKEIFLKKYRESGYICRAAKAANIDPSMVWHWRKEDPKFLEAFNDAEEVALMELEDKARKRALSADGEVMNRWILERRDRARYGDRREINLSGPVPFYLTLGDKRGDGASLLPESGDQSKS